MINFRYHIISITAVFLALGLGLALGTSFGNRALVGSLQDRQTTLDREVTDKRSTNAKLQAELAQAKDRADKFEQQAVIGPMMSGQLKQVPVLLVAPNGIDGESLDRLKTALTTSGADFAGTLRLDRRLSLDGDNATKIASILGAGSSASRSDLRKQLVSALVNVLATGAKRPAGGGSTTTTAPESGTTTTSTTSPGDIPSGTKEATLITALRNGGFLRFEPPENGKSSDQVVLDGGYRYVFVSGPGADLSDDALLQPLVKSLSTSSDIPVVVASAAVGSDPESVRLAVVGPIRDDSSVSQSVSTVDDLESFDGIAATILAIQELGTGNHGQYGVGAGATAMLPPVPTSP